mgnify:CR=1 FL=1
MRRRDITPYLWILPPMLVLAGICLYPAARLFFDSLFELRGATGKFVGLGNYAYMFQDEFIGGSLIRSAIYTGSTTLLSIGIGLLLALCLNESPLKRYLQALVVLPWAVPYAVVATAFKWFFNDTHGAANYLLIWLGLIHRPIGWLFDKNLAFAVLIASDAWMRIPFAAMVLLAGLQSIPTDLYESAKVDGAGAYERFRYITLPLLKAPLLLVLLIISIFSIRTVSLPLALTGGGPGEATTVFALYLYKVAFWFMNLGYGATLGVLLLFIVVVMSLIEIKFVKVEEVA